MSAAAGYGGQIKVSMKEDNQMCLAFESRIFDKKERQGGGLGCTLVTGFLGSGKTTLLRHILKQRDTLRIAVLVNELAEIDIDSVLLQSDSLNAAYGLSKVTLAHGCACCSTSGNLRDAILSVMSSKHNFDYLVIETSGVADPLKIAKDLENLGVRLDLIVTVVDAEALATILDVPVAKKQLEIADIILINKCDLASLGAISDVEDRVEDLTGGTKAIRCRFCNVPLDLVLNITMLINPTLATTTANTAVGIISHETLSTAPLLKIWQKPDILVSHETSRKELSHQQVHISKSLSNGGLMHGMLPMTDYQAHEGSTFLSVTFSSIRPLSLAVFQTIIVNDLRFSHDLFRAKGVLWFEENRSTRFYFHWSGQKRAEAVYGGIWESQPSTSLVFIGRDKSELDLISKSLLRAITVDGRHVFDSQMPSSLTAAEAADKFSQLMAADNRFRVCNQCQDLSQHKDSCSFSSFPTSVMFSLIGSRLRGVHEADLNATLMQIVNKNGAVFLIPVSSSREDHILQVSFGDETSPDLTWRDISTAATAAISKCFKNVCLCRCDMTPHQH
ncbi:hypothetical protein O6H91_14G021100 [Diphasiastrum complanatum]|uniref:Uncharacterized protein n=1 Tax=Diphasiastrum complanatum TaxID=34168 RepID=A0ACC2BM33_DIPCM|nr:hypothetical protein O6H91_14G021100 [Diphasiastrum complanatum]